LLPARHRAMASAMPEPSADRPGSAEDAVPQTAEVKTASKSGTPSTHRLVIRVKLLPNEPPQAPVRRRLSRGVLLLILGAAAVLLSWVGMRLFRTDPTSAPAVTQGTSKSESQSSVPVPTRSEPAHVVTDVPLPKPTTELAEKRSVNAKPVESTVPDQPDAAPSPINEVIPDVPRSARETIRGTIRVSTRVIVDKAGTVLTATADEPGPSRYFERLAIEASKQWTFAPADSQRIVLLTFNFTRAGTTARARSLQ
jgi:TonB family protein